MTANMPDVSVLDALPQQPAAHWPDASDPPAQAALAQPAACDGEIAASPASRSRRLAGLAVTGASLLVIAAFFWLQVLINRLTQGGFNTVLMLLSVVVEFVLILALSQSVSG
jgi:hypothetical protein